MAFRCLFFKCQYTRSLPRPPVPARDVMSKSKTNETQSVLKNTCLKKYFSRVILVLSASSLYLL